MEREDSRQGAAFAQGRLWVEAGMDRVRVELPTVHHYWFAGIYAAFAIPLSLAPVLADQGLPWLASLFALAGPWLYGPLVNLLAAGGLGAIVRWGNRLALAAAGLVALVLGLFALLEMFFWAKGKGSLRGFGEALWLAGVWGLAAAAAARLTQPAPVVTLDVAGLEIRWGSRRWAFPLESIASVEPAPGGRGELRINAEIVPVFRFLTQAERGWLAGQIAAAALQRRRALARQGQDPDAPAEPPQALLDLAGRGSG